MRFNQISIVAGYFTDGENQPQSLGLRAFQTGQVVEARRWLNERLMGDRS